MNEDNRWLEEWTGVKDALDVLIDILCSGQGHNFTEWHRRSVKEFADEVPPEHREEVWKAYTEWAMRADELPTLEEIREVKLALLGTDEVEVIFTIK